MLKLAKPKTWHTIGKQALYLDKSPTALTACTGRALPISRKQNIMIYMMPYPCSNEDFKYDTSGTLQIFIAPTKTIRQ